MEKTKGNITIDDIRNVSGYENLSNEELQTIVDGLIELSQILMAIHLNGNLSNE